jgi:hypothetical protein
VDCPVSLGKRVARTKRDFSGERRKKRSRVRNIQKGSQLYGRVSVVFACSGTFREEVTTVEQSAANERRRVNGRQVTPRLLSPFSSSSPPFSPSSPSMLLIHLLYSWLVLITCTVVAQSGVLLAPPTRLAHPPLNPLIAAEPITGPTPHDAGQLVFGPLDSHTKSGPRAGAQNHRVGEEGDQAFFPTIARKEVCFRDVYSQPGESWLLFKAVLGHH